MQIEIFYNLLSALRAVSNMYAQVAQARSCANHVQHIEWLSHATFMRCYMPHGTKGQLSYLNLTELKLHLFELYFIGWTINRWSQTISQMNHTTERCRSYFQWPVGKLCKSTSSSELQAQWWIGAHATEHFSWGSWRSLCWTRQMSWSPCKVTRTSLCAYRSRSKSLSGSWHDLDVVLCLDLCFTWMS